MVLFSHPADFTPVCTEFIAFQRIYPELRKLNTELLGLSLPTFPGSAI
ncbi:redoxin domain-containing protein [Thermoactinomyces mirandus]|nr:redoxin domain-containing protein [Thermoactinomyces mirandus]